MLHAGSTNGITAAIAEWGGLLQAYHKSYKVPDVTLSKIGYQTVIQSVPSLKSYSLDTRTITLVCRTGLKVSAITGQRSLLRLL